MPRAMLGDTDETVGAVGVGQCPRLGMIVEWSIEPLEIARIQRRINHVDGVGHDIVGRADDLVMTAGFCVTPDFAGEGLCRFLGHQ